MEPTYPNQHHFLLESLLELKIPQFKARELPRPPDCISIKTYISEADGRR